MDERYLEQASALEQAQREEAINQAQAANARPGQPYCDDCGELIPAERRAAQPMAYRCIGCQEVFEFTKKGYAR